MLTIYRRHGRRCEHRKLGRTFRRCRCVIWVDGFIGGVEVRKSLKTANWQKAQDLVREWESTQSEPKQSAERDEPMTIQRASEKFVADAVARYLTATTIYKYRLLFKQIAEFAQTRGLRYVKELSLDTLEDFRCTWKEGPRSAQKKLERMRSFFRFCQRHKWVEENPAEGMEGPKVPPVCPTLPFTREEMIKILAATDQYAERAGVANAQRLRAFVLLLRYSGLRIGDAVRCGPDRFNGNKLFLYTAKTGVPVHYSPWVRSRQEQLEADLQRAWSQDPVALMQTRGTTEGHRKDEPVN
jgi:integrase/recombinase XerD